MSGWTLGRRDGVAIVVVMFGHALLVLLFARAREQERIATEPAHRATLFLLDRAPQKITSRSIVASPSISTPTIDVPAPVLRTQSDVAPGEPRMQDRAIDWRGEAERAARHSIDANASPQRRGFEEKAPQPRAPKPKPFNWDPAPGRFGIAGGLPYMELGKRCVIGLGFFGCAIGELPPADGTLFDGMKDGDRERSSVPETPR
jgi:hypothetical protein